MPDYLNDLLYACQMRLDHGDRAGQALVDVIQTALRAGNDSDAIRADRALRTIAIGRSVARSGPASRLP